MLFLKKVLPYDEKTRRKISRLPRIYLVVRYADIAIISFPFTKRYTAAGPREKDYCNKVPLVYEFDDCNGTCENFFLRKITSTTSGSIIGWFTDFEEAVAAKELALIRQQQEDIRK